MGVNGIDGNLGFLRKNNLGAPKFKYNLGYPKS
jgi:hypothetical protein